MEIWTKKALTDDMIVVELLLGLKFSSTDCYATSTPLPVLHPHLKWGRRQPRSTKKASILRKKNREMGSSPTTPFSWSGSASLSDGYEESSGHLDRPSGSRSKELASLRINLKEQRMRCDNFKRMKLDLRLQSGNGSCPVLDEPDLRVLNQGNWIEASDMDCSFSVLSRTSMKQNDLASSDYCQVQNDIENRDRRFVLPDLNMTPPEDFAHYREYAMS